MKPCPRCLAAHWQTDGKAPINYIPDFMESCHDCCDPGEESLTAREKDQFRAAVRRMREAQNSRNKTSRTNIHARKPI